MFIRTKTLREQNYSVETVREMDISNVQTNSGKQPASCNDSIGTMPVARELARPTTRRQLVFKLKV